MKIVHHILLGISMLLIASCSKYPIRQGLFYNATPDNGFPDIIIIKNNDLMFADFFHNSADSAISLAECRYFIRKEGKNYYSASVGLDYIPGEPLNYSVYDLTAATSYDYKPECPTDSLNIRIQIPEPLPNATITVTLTWDFHSGESPVTFSLLNSETEIRIPANFIPCILETIIRYTSESLPAGNSYFAPIRFCTYVSKPQNSESDRINQINLLFRPLQYYQFSPWFSTDYFKLHGDTIKWHGCDYVRSKRNIYIKEV